MSITIITREPRVDRCTCARDGCDARFSQSGAVGSYCSVECQARDRGETVLNHLARDHRFCGSCYRPRKVVYRPDESDVPDLRKKALLIRESFVGFETLTEFAEGGPYGIECNCGTTDHRTAEHLFRAGEPWEWWLARAVDQLADNGVWEYRLDAAALADAVWRTDDLALAVGRALAAAE